MTRVINFSGGKTSAMMAILLKPTDEDIVLFDDTKREHPKTYKFIDDFEKYEGITVYRASYEHHAAPGLQGFDAMTAHKTYLPNRVKRICTDLLKVQTSRKFLKSIGVTEFEQYIGFRADEEHRVLRFKPTYKKTITKFPLYEMGINKAMVNEFWANKPYNLEIPSILGNCDLCFLKGKNTIIKILQHYPELADKWINDEESNLEKKKTQCKKGKAQYFPDVTYRQLLNAAKNQKTLFELDEALPAYSCSCNSF